MHVFMCVCTYVYLLGFEMQQLCSAGCRGFSAARDCLQWVPQEWHAHVCAHRHSRNGMYVHTHQRDVELDTQPLLHSDRTLRTSFSQQRGRRALARARSHGSAVYPPTARLLCPSSYRPFKGHGATPLWALILSSRPHVRGTGTCFRVLTFKIMCTLCHKLGMILVKWFNVC